MVLSVLMKTLYFLWTGLFLVGRPSVIIVQNPPCLPTLLVAPLLAAYHRAKYIIDWHNFSYTILALSHTGKLVQLVKKVELGLARFGHTHLTVTTAMKSWLVKNAPVKEESVHVLYDRPNHKFRHLTMQERHDYLTRFFQGLDDENWGDESPHTEIDEATGQAKFKPNNFRDKAIVVSSTSWTEDEDFGILWKAIMDCEHQLAKAGPKRTSLFPTIYLVITGKGPLRAYYEDLFKSQKLYFFKIKTVWLPAEDYPKLLASADLGICLHKSSSGLDLPMKVVDMMGAGLPVLAYKYNCIGELIEEEENGLLFEDSDHLTQLLLDLFHGFPKSSKTIKAIASNLALKPLPPWKGHWNKIVLDKIIK